MFDLTRIQQQASQSWQEEETPVKSAVNDLRNGGTLSRSLSGYQERGAQLEMAQLVEQAIDEKKPAVIEAATGTGKSLAYLIPVIRSGKKAIISTANKALQEQLYNKDVPFCQEHIQQFPAALLKGKSNYLCLQRFDQEQNEGLQVHVQDIIFKRIERAIDDQSFNGDFETLPFTVPGEIRARIQVDEHECARRKCPLFNSCYYYRAREQAQLAQVIITNHDLLLLNAHSRNKLLPSHDVTIIDEAHTLESVATNQFSVEIRASQISSLLALQRLKNNTEEKTRDEAKNRAEELWASLDQLLPSNGRLALTQPVTLGISLARSLERLSNQLDLNKPKNMTSEDEELYKRTMNRCDTLAKNIRAVFSVNDKEYVYYLEKAENRPITISATPLNVALLLRDTLFSADRTIICTSATLSSSSKSGASFDYYREQTGIEHPNTLMRILPPIFNYQKNALLYIPKDIPEPAYGKTTEAATYEQAIAQRMQALIEASNGRAFLLFSSRRMLASVAEQIIPKLDKYTLLLQGDLPPAELIKQFRNSPKAVLFGLKTFWEGVDVQGEALSLVIIDKLPFAPIDDPIMAAKLKYIEAHGHNAFSTYSLPSITLSLKQGVGRLIRSVNDRGVMAILDTRIHTKSYGKMILSCLPPARRTISLEAVQDFFLPLSDERQQFTQVQNILTRQGLEKHSYFKEMNNAQIILKMQEIINNEARSQYELRWLQRGLSFILSENS